jgi:type IV pilus modification protein PilV
MKSQAFRFQRGFSLIEVLIAIVVLSIGLLALAALQISLIRASGDAKTQSIALSLAKQKIEDLRAFDNTADYISLTSLANESLPDNGGDQGGVDFTRNTTITRYVYDKSANSGAGGFITIPNTTTDTVLISATCGTATNGHQCIAGKDFKTALVQVSWSDANGVAQSVSLEDAFSGLDPGDSARVARSVAGASPRKVQVRINDPGSEAGVIPIAINTNDPNAPVSTAATNPRPDVITRNQNTQYVVETRFDVLTYAGLVGGGFLAQSRVETSAITCSCSTGAAPAGFGFRPTYWDGTRYVPPTLATYAAPAGWAQESLAANQRTESDKCNTCCRDHHDPSGVTGAKFDPRRVEVTAQYGLNAAHTHYKLLQDGTRQDTTASGGAYTESCRLIRVDGIFRTASDIYSDHHNLLRTDNGDSNSVLDFAPTPAAISAYQAFALRYLDNRVVDNTVGDVTFNAPVAHATVDTLESDTNLNDPATITMVHNDSVGKWLHSRGLYIDYLEPTARVALERAQDNCVGTDGLPTNLTQAEKQACVLPFVPFTSINLTELARWTPVSGNQVVVTNNDFLCSVSVTDTDCASIDPNTPVRGKARPGANPVANVDENAISTVLSSNAGLALLQYDIDGDTWLVEQTTDPPHSNRTDFQVISISGSNSNGGTYTIDPNLWTYTSANPTISANPFATCTAQGLANNGSVANVEGNNLVYACTSQTVGVPLTISVGTYNRSYVSDSSVENTGSLSLSCTGPNGAISNTWTGNGNATNKYPVRVCKNYQINSTGTSPTPLSVTPDSNEGRTSETTTVVWSSNIAGGSTITLNVSEQTAVKHIPTTCTYTVSCNAQGNNCNNTFAATEPLASLCN